MSQPFLYECPGCGGRGCKDCTEGLLKLESCPNEFVEDGDWQVIEAADMADKGLLPVTGGLLDQAQIAIDAIRFIWREHEICKGLRLEESHA